MNVANQPGLQHTAATTAGKSSRSALDHDLTGLTRPASEIPDRSQDQREFQQALNQLCNETEDSDTRASNSLLEGPSGLSESFEHGSGENKQVDADSSAFAPPGTVCFSSPDDQIPADCLTDDETEVRCPEFVQMSDGSVRFSSELDNASHMSGLRDQHDSTQAQVWLTDQVTQAWFEVQQPAEGVPAEIQDPLVRAQASSQVLAQMMQEMLARARRAEPRHWQFSIPWLFNGVQISLEVSDDNIWQVHLSVSGELSEEDRLALKNRLDNDLSCVELVVRTV